MSIQSPINTTSLNLVYEELVATVKQSASQLEAFTANRDDGEPLQALIESLQQVSGIISVVQISGADLLTKEMLAVATEVPLGVSEQADLQLGVLTTAYFVLLSYLELCLTSKKALPVVLLPCINDLRQSISQETIVDSYFLTVDLSIPLPTRGSPRAVVCEEIKVLARRLRHMYQVGLLAVFREQQVNLSLGMMQRALQRISKVSLGRKSYLFWHLAELAVQALQEQSMVLPKARKKLLGLIDRQIKQLQVNGANYLDNEPAEVLLKEFVYILAISGSDDTHTEEILSLFSLADLTVDEREIELQRDALRGPSSNTISSLINVLQDEINVAKNILEKVSQGALEPGGELDNLMDELNKIADILAVVGLGTPSNSLKEEIVLLQKISEQGEAPDGEVMLEIANTLLYIESTVKSLANSNLTSEQLDVANRLSKDHVIATSQIEDAEEGVLQEAAAGLTLIKRALSAYTESSYDGHHIANVPATLNGVRGAFVVLNLSRAQAVVNSSLKFVTEFLMVKNSPAALESMLETFADAVIGLEYYLDAVTSDRDTDDKVLELAEESLSALGCPVS